MRRALFLLLFFMVCGALYWSHLHLRPGDEPLYRELMCENNRNSRRALQTQPVVQRRAGVIKEIWIPERGQRRHIRIGSKFSVLTLKEKRKTIEAAEELQGVECALEEGTIAAASGHYFYPSRRLSLDHASLENETLRLHSPRIELAMDPSHSLSALQAEGPCQILFPHSQLTSEQSLILDPQQLQIFTQGPLHFEDDEVALDAKRGTLTYRQEQGKAVPSALMCDGEVKLVTSKLKEQSCGLSDHLAYDPTTRVIRLFSDSPRRVLFWQRGSDSLLTAPEVRIHRGPDTNSEFVEGIGDVRFSLDLGERDRIQRLFEKYL